MRENITDAEKTERITEDLNTEKPQRKRICLFAGTSEGRRLAEILSSPAELTVCVATEYGEILLDGIEGIEVHAGRMDEDEMELFFDGHGFDKIIDATHPYATAVTENIKRAAESKNIPFMRILRENEPEPSDAVYVDSADEVRDYLADKEGAVFVTTGSKELSSFVGLDMSRVWVRVLPLISSLEACASAGVLPSHIIAAQGPFTEEINAAQMKMINARYMVTKASGKNGGFGEKIRAAASLGVTSVIIGQPPQLRGFTPDEALAALSKELEIGQAKVYVIGIGPGSPLCLSEEAREIIDGCDAVLGAKSVADCVLSGKSKRVYYEYLPERVLEVLSSHPSIRHAAVLMRGDVGFYSGAKKLSSALVNYDTSLIPGVSSPAFFAARLGVSWDDAALISLHGRDCGIVRAVRESRKVFALTGGENTVGSVLKRLCEYGLGSIPVTVGERLSYKDEKITRGTAELLSRGEYDPLSLLYIENGDAVKKTMLGIPDDEFIRGEVPMTKQEVRAVSVSKLSLLTDAVVYDIGAGTGSVSVECAACAPDGTVYAVEKNEDACDLIELNRKKFGCENLVVVNGVAPDVLDSLPAPTHAFIGGSSGNLHEIITVLLEKNPRVRIVVNTVTLETQAEVMRCAELFGFSIFEAVSVNISRSRKMGKYNMMTAQNPVYVFTMEESKA